MHIRLAAPADLPQINELYQQFYTSHAALQPAYFQPTTENGDFPKRTIENPEADILVAAENNTILGFAHITESKTLPHPPIVQHSYATVVDLMVRPDRRRRGVATALLAACKTWAAARKLEYLELKVLTENRDAIKLYEKTGFTPAHQTMRLKL